MDATGLTVTQWPEWWEFMMQWGGLMTQAAAAAGSFAAVVAALRIARGDERWRQAHHEQQMAVIESLVRTELVSIATGLRGIRDALLDVQPLNNDVAFPRDAVRSIVAYLPYLSADSCWRSVESLGCFPTEKGRRLGRVLALLGMMKRHAESMTTWTSTVGELRINIDGYITLANELLGHISAFTQRDEVVAT